MRKIFTIFIITAALAVNCYAQSFEVYLSNDRNDSLGVITNGEEITLSTSINLEKKFYFLVKNTTANDVFAKIIKRPNTIVEGASTTICCGTTNSNEFPQCVSGDTTPEFKLEPNEISGAADLAFLQGPNAGTSYITLVVYNSNDNNDSISFKLKITTTDPPISVSNNISNNFSIYPNPANTNFTIGYDFSPNSYVEVYNVLGKIVAKIGPNAGSNVNIDCSKWEKGYYFCRLYKNNKVEKTVKLIITR